MPIGARPLPPAPALGPDGNAFRRADALALALLLGGAAVLVAAIRRYGLMVLDEGYVVHAAERMTRGEVLYRDVFAHYGPLRFHALALAFEAFRPSLLVARTLFGGVILIDVALTYRLARRFAGPAGAAVPAAFLALVPGPWTKAFFGLTVALGALAIARALERPTRGRLFAQGLAVGVGVATRQDVGLVLLGLALVAAALPALLPAHFGRSGARSLARAGRDVGWCAAGAVLVLGTIAAWYAAHGALGALAELTLGRAFTQRNAYGFHLPLLFAARGQIAEGRLAAAVMAIPLALMAAAAVAWPLALRRRGPGPRMALVAVLWVAGAAGLSNAYYQLFVLRFLQSAIPYTLLATWLVAEAVAAARDRWPGAGGRRVASALVAGALGLPGFVVWAVLAGIPSVLPSAEYTGSLRARQLDAPVEVLGDELRVSWPAAEEIRLLRAFVAHQVPPGQPILLLPFAPLYWDLLERPNPLWLSITDDHPGNFLLTDAEKREQVRRLLAGPTRVAIVDGNWLVQPGPRDALRRALHDEFHPVRICGGMMVLERGRDADATRLLDVLARTSQGRVRAGDLDALREIAAERPDDPLPWRVLGLAALNAGHVQLALDALSQAARLDPVDPRPRELRAQLLLGMGRRAEAAAEVRAARSVRESPETRVLAMRLASPGLAPGRGARGDPLAPVERRVR